MVYAIAHFDCILPNPVLNIFGPCRFEFFLTDRARGIPQGGIVRCTDPLFRGSLVGGFTIPRSCALVWRFRVEVLVVDRFSRFDPILTQRQLHCTTGPTKTVKTYPLVDIPTAILSAPSSVCHPLVCLEMPVQVTGFLLLALLGSVKATATGATSIGLRFIKTSQQPGSGSVIREMSD